MNWQYQPKIRLLARQLKAGGVCAYPTEAVWGLGCDPFNRAAVEHILDLKNRDIGKGLILVAADISQFKAYLEGISAEQREKLRNSWPGPNTWLVPDNGYSPSWIRGKFSSVALRVSPHPIVAGLCRAFGGAIVSTSANPQGLPPARNVMRIHRYFHGLIDGQAPGLVNSKAEPSVIRDLSSGEIIRA